MTLRHAQGHDEQSLTMKKYLYLVIITLLSSVFFFFRVDSSFRMPPSYNYDSDFGRDLLRMSEILHGKLTLIGPQLSFAGLHMAPYSFYIFAPFLFLANLDHRILFYVNGSVFLVGFVILFLFLRKNWGKNYAFLSVLWLLSTPYIILSARTPGNAFSYLPLFILVSLVLLYKNKVSNKQHFLIGFIEGVIINFHPINLLILPPLHLGKILFLTKKAVGGKIRSGLLTLLGIGAGFSPVALFEIKHSFVITKSLLNPTYYLQYFGSGKVGSSSIVQTLNEMHGATSTLIPFSMFGLLVVNILLFTKIKRDKKNTLFFVVGLLNVMFLILLKQGAVHYFLPTLLLLQLFLLIQAHEFKFKYAFLVMLIGLNLLFFPVRLFQPSRNLTKIESNFKTLAQTKFLPQENLNVILINETHLSKVGYEYRYLLRKYSYDVDDEYSYNLSKYLLVVDEGSTIKDFKNERSWEFDQFGAKELIGWHRADGTTFFLFKKL